MNLARFNSSILRRSGAVALLWTLVPLLPGCEVQVRGPRIPPPPPAPVVEVQADVPAASVATAPAADQYADNDPSALQDFHGALDAHGQWVEDPNYGTVWTPNPAEVGADFTPYQTAGHWTYDNDQYVWVSDYDWGWAPYHYGRWVTLSSGGWGWIPGREYAGAWVNWRTGAPGYEFVGWAPAAPEFYWRGGVAIGIPEERRPIGRYAYVSHNDVFASGGPRGHVIVGERASGIERDTHPFEGGAHAGASASGGRGMHGGPAPAAIGIPATSVAHPSPMDQQRNSKATTFAKPSTAVAAGGHAAVNTRNESGAVNAGAGHTGVGARNDASGVAQTAGGHAGVDTRNESGAANTAAGHTGVGTRSDSSGVAQTAGGHAGVDTRNESGAVTTPRTETNANREPQNKVPLTKQAPAAQPQASSRPAQGKPPPKKK